tara:strand:+ start:756 stop:1286 length:531 start_codon:yes stop_codon:yes gene_type:complete
MNQSIQICNIDNEINNAIFQRNFPDRPLQPLFNPTPTSTRYRNFPITNNNITGDLVNSNKTKCKDYDKFSLESNFNPGTSAPVNHYLQSIDLETSLRNQHIRKHKYNENCWVPGSMNNLYKDYNNNNNILPYGCMDPYIVNDQHFCNFNPNLDDKNIGFASFNNHTRNQLKNLHTN